MNYLLQCDIATKQRGKPVYFKCWVNNIGPAYTESINEAERFESKEDAMKSPAYTHWLTGFQPTETVTENEEK